MSATVPAWQRHLDALFQGVDEGLIELRFIALDPATKAKKVQQVFVAPGDHAAILAALKAHAKCDCYVGMAVRRDTSSGKKENCTLLTAVFADIDVKNGDTAEAVERRVAEFPLKPSIVVRSGSGGLHVVWLLVEPVDAQDPELEPFLRRLAHALQADISVAEVARVLRIAGTRNWKHRPPRRVELLDCDTERRYHLSELDALLPDDPSPEPKEKKEKATAGDETYAEGGRNNFLYAEGRRWHAKGATVAMITAHLRHLNEARCTPPLDEGELADIITNVTTQGNRPDFHADEPWDVEKLLGDAQLLELPEGLTEKDLAPRIRLLADAVRRRRLDALQMRELLGMLKRTLKAAKVPGAGEWCATLQALLADQQQMAGATVEDDEPAEGPVDGAALLTNIFATLKRYVRFPSDAAARATTLWIVVTYLVEAIYILPMLLVSSPTRRCGKSTLLMLLEQLVRKGLAVSNISPAALFRAVELMQPALLLDEYETYGKDNEELRGIVNSGHTRGTARVIRCVGEDQTPTVFSTWCAKVVGLIGKPADTIIDRSIVIELKRKAVSDPVELLRLDRLRGALAPYRRDLRRWALDHGATIAAAEPDVPLLNSDRAIDNWRPLLAIADAVGEPWATEARQAARELTTTVNEDQPYGVELLADLKMLFDAALHNGEDDPEQALATSKLVDLLKGLAERPWATFGKNEKGLTQHTLARLLKPFGVHSKKVKVSGVAENCYRRADLQEPWDRYLQTPRNDSELGTEPENTDETWSDAGSGSASAPGTEPRTDGQASRSNGSGTAPGTGTDVFPGFGNSDGPGSEFRPETEGPEGIHPDDLEAVLDALNEEGL